jgi:hypothetical protein
MIEVSEHQVLILVVSSVVEVPELQPLSPDFSLGYESEQINRALAQNFQEGRYFSLHRSIVLRGPGF